MILDQVQIRKLNVALDLIQDALYGHGSHTNKAVYLSVAGDYCNEIAEVERQKANLDREEKGGRNEIKS